MDTFFIYGLVDPLEPQVFRYVGQCESMVARVKTHKQQCQGYYGINALWKLSLGLFGREFEMRLIDVVRGYRRDAVSAEHAHIKRLASHHRLNNGSLHRKRNSDVPVAMYDNYIESAWMIFEMLDVTEGDKSVNLWRAARVAKMCQRFESQFPELAICRAKDDYFWALQKIWENIHNPIDDDCVSR